jgi:hypothetical protein
LLQCCMSAATLQDNIVELQLRFDSTLTLDERHRQARPGACALAHPPPHTPGLPSLAPPRLRQSLRGKLSCASVWAVLRWVVACCVLRYAACCTSHVVRCMQERERREAMEAALTKLVGAFKNLKLRCGAAVLSSRSSLKYNEALSADHSRSAAPHSRRCNRRNMRRAACSMVHWSMRRRSMHRRYYKKTDGARQREALLRAFAHWRLLARDAKRRPQARALCSGSAHATPTDSHASTRTRIDAIAVVAAAQSP